MAKAKLIGAAVAAVLVIILIVQNTESVATRVLFWTIPLPRAVWLAITFAAGLAVGIVATLALLRRQRKAAASKDTSAGK